jgi:hypothetical protein
MNVIQPVGNHAQRQDRQTAAPEKKTKRNDDGPAPTPRILGTKTERHTLPKRTHRAMGNTPPARAQKQEC